MELFLAMLLAQHVFKQEETLTNIKELLTEIKKQNEEMLKKSASDMEEARGWHQENTKQFEHSMAFSREWVNEQRSNRINDRLEQHESWERARAMEHELITTLAEKGLVSVVQIDRTNEGENEEKEGSTPPADDGYGGPAPTTARTRRSRT